MTVKEEYGLAGMLALAALVGNEAKPCIWPDGTKHEPASVLYSISLVLAAALAAAAYFGWEVPMQMKFGTVALLLVTLVRGEEDYLQCETHPGPILGITKLLAVATGVYYYMTLKD